jgi:hypothetical protein
MSRLRDSIFYCTCGAENFFDAAGLWATGETADGCWKCYMSLQPPPRIRIGETVVMLNPESKLFAHHLEDGHTVDFTKPFAEVTGHPTDASRLGLKNLSGESWAAVLDDGSVREVPPTRSVAVSNVARIHFGKAEGEVESSPGS